MIWTLLSVFIFSVLAISFFFFCGFEFKTQRFGRNLNNLGVFILVTLGLIFLVLAFLILGLGSVEYGVGHIATDGGQTALKVNMPYAVKGAVDVIPEIGPKNFSPHIVLLCAIEISHGCYSPTNWLTYRLRYLPPPYFLKLKDGTYREISFKDTEIIRDTARQ